MAQASPQFGQGNRPGGFRVNTLIELPPESVISLMVDDVSLAFSGLERKAYTLSPSLISNPWESTSLTTVISTEYFSN